MKAQKGIEFLNKVTRELSEACKDPADYKRLHQLNEWLKASSSPLEKMALIAARIDHYVKYGGLLKGQLKSEFQSYCDLLSQSPYPDPAMVQLIHELATRLAQKGDLNFFNLIPRSMHKYPEFISEASEASISIDIAISYLNQLVLKKPLRGKDTQHEVVRILQWSPFRAGMIQNRSTTHNLYFSSQGDGELLQLKSIARAFSHPLPFSVYAYPDLEKKGWLGPSDLQLVVFDDSPYRFVATWAMEEPLIEAKATQLFKLVTNILGR